MYFNNKGNTNIDNDFDRKSLNFSKFKWPMIIICVVVLLIVIGLFIMKSISKVESSYFVDLIGDEIMTIYKGNDYIEPGYNAYDDKQNDLTSEVDIKSTLDINSLGNYEIVYSLGNTSVTRYVNVIEKPVGATYIYLKGKSTIYLDKGEKYVESGYIVIDTVDSNLTDKVKITNSVDTSKMGTYKIVYSVVNSSGVTTSIYRTIIVLDSEISLSQSTKENTNSSVTINVFVNDNYFDYMILPNGEKVTKTSYAYSVSSNGTYKFTSVNKKGTKKEASITIKNIDKEKPTGTCSGIYEREKTTITISAKDNIGINKYVLNGKSYTDNKIVLNSKLDVANITIYDKAGNSSNVSCKIVVKDLCPDGTERKKYNFVYYSQKDYKEPYSGSTIAVTGCGPTSMAMVLTYYTGCKVTPPEMAVWSRNHGYEGNGTARKFISAVADAYGVVCKDGYTYNDIIGELKKGRLMVVYGKGEWLYYGGHYIMLRGITDDGKILVGDPYSKSNSQKEWEFRQVRSGSRQIWSCYEK